MKQISQDQWNELYNQVYGFFFRRVSDRYSCEELTTLTLHDFLSYEGEVVSESGLMWKIARNKLSNYYRSKKKHPIVDLDCESDISSEYSVEYKNRVKLLLECIHKNTTNEEYTLIESLVMYDFNSTQISKESGTKPATLRKKLSRTLSKVKESCKKIWI